MVPEDVRNWKLSNTSLQRYSYTTLLDYWLQECQCYILHYDRAVVTHRYNPKNKLGFKSLKTKTGLIGI
jgi:hypothetical protein